jgi:hypothetical protein
MLIKQQRTMLKCIFVRFTFSSIFVPPFFAATASKKCALWTSLFRPYHESLSLYLVNLIVPPHLLLWLSLSFSLSISLSAAIISPLYLLFLSLSLSLYHARTHARTRRDTCSLFFFFLICSDNSEVNVRSDLFLSHRNSLSYFIFPSLDFLLSLFASQPCILFFSIFIYLSLQHTHTHTHTLIYLLILSPLTSKKVCLILFRSLIVHPSLYLLNLVARFHVQIFMSPPPIPVTLNALDVFALIL